MVSWKSEAVLSMVRTRIYCTVGVAGSCCSEGLESEGDACSERVMYKEPFLSQRESFRLPVQSFWFGKTDADAEINEDCNGICSSWSFS